MNHKLLEDAMEMERSVVEQRLHGLAKAKSMCEHLARKVKEIDRKLMACRSKTTAMETERLKLVFQLSLWVRDYEQMEVEIPELNAISMREIASAEEELARDKPNKGLKVIPLEETERKLKAKKNRTVEDELWLESIAKERVNQVEG